MSSSRSKLKKTEKTEKTKKTEKTIFLGNYIYRVPAIVLEKYSFFSFFSFFGLRMESAVFPRRGPFYLSPAGSRCHCLMAAAPRPDSPEIQYEDDFWECLGREPSC